MKKLYLAIPTLMTMAMALMPVNMIAVAGTGNGAPSGPHYNLNIIGVQNEKVNMDGEGGHVIFVELYSSKMGKVRVATDINLSPAPEGESFAVLDKNGTDGEAQFQLPTDVATTYTVWVRGLGKPGGEADMQTCAWDPVEEEYVCGISHVEVRTKGKKSFTDVSAELLYIDGVPLFDPVYEDYFWSYANNGLKLAQLRFYPVTTP